MDSCDIIAHANQLYFPDCKALLVTSLALVSSAMAITQTFTSLLYKVQWARKYAICHHDISRSHLNPMSRPHLRLQTLNILSSQQLSIYISFSNAKFNMETSQTSEMAWE